MLLKLQNRILKMVAQDEDPSITLIQLCTDVEGMLPGSYASILRLDSKGRLQPCAAPNLPVEYTAALKNAKIGPDVGSCGSAAFLGKSVTVADIEHDARWANYKALALAAGLRACFSSPIFSTKGEVLGTFALYFPEVRSPSPFEQSIVEGCLPLCMVTLEHHERMLENQRLAFTDALTGLANRAKFNDVLNRLSQAKNWSLLSIDIDNLKTVNDTFGHAAGDDLIYAIAQRLSTVAGRVPVYRLSGDEFAIIVDVAKLVKAERLAKRILVQIDKPAVCAGHTIRPSATVGIAYSGPELSVSEVRHHADIALYHAKETGRGSFATFSAGLGSIIAQRSETIQTVATALREDRIEAWYQPIVRIETGEIVGVEALARMRRKDGTIAPAALFHEATKDVFVAACLACHMIANISRDVGYWLKLGIPFQHVGINLSAADLRDDNLAENLTLIFQREGIPLHRVILEVTESVYLSGADQSIVKKIAALRNSGFKVALDDFGTGYASLTHLITLPIDIIKIDKSFVDRLAPDDVGTGIIEGILLIASRLGIRVVAEGIETLAQADMLAERGCFLGQGYLYSKAVPHSEMTSLLLKRAQKDMDGSEKAISLSSTPGRRTG